MFGGRNRHLSDNRVDLDTCLYVKKCKKKREKAPVGKLEKSM